MENGPFIDVYRLFAMIYLLNTMIFPVAELC